MKNLVWALIVLIFGLLVGVFRNRIPIIELLNRTDIMLDLITLLVGGVALYIYSKQKDDKKRDAANILFIEITNAESILSLAKENLDKKLPSDVVFSTYSIPTESWSKYKYLFVRDFDRTEWDSISDFYDKANSFDQAVDHNKSLFQKNEDQIRASLDKTLAEITKENLIDVAKIESDPREGKKWQQFVILTEKFYYQFMKRQDLYFYRPDKPILDAQLYLNNINLQISSTTVGSKLKSLGNITT